MRENEPNLRALTWERNLRDVKPYDPPLRLVPTPLAMKVLENERQRACEREKARKAGMKAKRDSRGRYAHGKGIVDG